jgi:hypothetical protein
MSYGTRRSRRKVSSLTASGKSTATLPDREVWRRYRCLVDRPDASHWVHHDEADRVNDLLIDFFTAEAKT